jgi:putative addiction module component (TIGR02574 family)
MTMIDIARLTPQERLDLIGELWDSLDAEANPVPPALKETLDQRNAAFAEERARAIPWSEVRAKLRPGQR